ncbi:hypothetical protein I5G97_gp047 [Mycobacterium phage Curiosium]|uniref:Uncharacterized protein n=1 Tax=Mycobacterium phage Curiosium TaxID=2599859 RepID=A0A5J6TW11_9CAUD|nr:hypothetical protein I5G97_gp047 [Mycobacterium phage Curiosium]QFG14107.1 hypothetical protein PBI_CURIOSIUM_63 [Mycobacterium phage Curiosium]
MSNPNFVHVGRVEVRPSRNLGMRGLETPVVAVVVGVRADLGHVVVNTEAHKGSGLPPMTADQAAALTVLVDRAAGAATSLSEAYRAYQGAMQQAEVDLAQAFSREVGA